jgi:hypothetical protein
MPTPERRHTPRTTLEKLSYIQIEPDNGGIVLNVSPDGLCFHSIAAVEKNGPLRFSLLEQNRRIAASGELTWTDGIQKIGGLRFTTLTAEARQQVQDWMTQPGAPLEEHTSTLGSAILKAFPRLRLFRFDANPHFADSRVLGAAFPKIRLRMKLSGFARGLATGLLLSALCASLFLLYAHRRDLGESLIHLGQRMAGELPIEKQSATQPTAPQPVIQKQPTTLAAKRVPPPSPAPSSAHAQTPASRISMPAARPAPTQTLATSSAKLVARPPVSQAIPQSSPLKPQLSSSTAPNAAALATHPAASIPPVAPPPTTVSPVSSSTLAANRTLGKPDSAPQPESPGTVQMRSFAEAGAASLPQMFFELGKFKDEMRARDLGDRLSQLGLRPSVVQKGHLWMSAFYVLVGPYSDPEEATQSHKNLLSHGYQPRPFERGSRDFTFISGLTLAGMKLPVGDFTINWESYVTDAKVKFEQRGYLVTTASGQWVKRPARYQRDEYVYFKSSNGSRLLREIHFSGLDRALVFRDAS